MSDRRFDLPLESTAASRFLVWIVAGLVYLAVVALAVAAVADSALKLYNMRARIVTVTLPAIEEGSAVETAVEAALEILRRTRGVTSASPVPQAELEQLIEPWLGDVRDRQGLPLPQLIDVTLDPLARPDLPVLQQRLREVVPGATIGVEAMSRDRAESMAAFFRNWGVAAGLLVLIGSLGVVVLITRMTLSMHTDTLEMLRLMGAPDGYIARQFERHALLNGLRGGLLGFGCAVATVLLLLYSSRRMELAGAIQLGLRPVDWVLLACVPVVSALLVTVVARVTALWRLSKMP